LPEFSRFPYSFSAETWRITAVSSCFPPLAPSAVRSNQALPPYPLQSLGCAHVTRGEAQSMRHKI
jgi:hypothetical protein